jgi:hypothetical protein
VEAYMKLACLLRYWDDFVHHGGVKTEVLLRQTLDIRRESYGSFGCDLSKALPTTNVIDGLFTV